MWIDPVFTAGSNAAKFWELCKENKIATLEKYEGPVNPPSRSCTTCGTQQASPSSTPEPSCLRLVSSAEDNPPSPPPRSFSAISLTSNSVLASLRDRSPSDADTSDAPTNVRGAFKSNTLMRRRPAKINSNNPPTSSCPLYRICLKSAIKSVVAISNTIEEIHQNWKWIEVNMLPQIEVFDLESGSAEEIATMWQFVVLKFASLATESYGASGIEDEALLKKMLGAEQSEDFVTCVSCEFQTSRTARKGHLYISLVAIYFHSAMLSTRIKIPWSEVTEITLKPSLLTNLIGNNSDPFISRNATKSASIIVSTTDVGQSEYQLDNVENAHDVYGLMNQAWERVVEKILADVITHRNYRISKEGAYKGPWQSYKPKRSSGDAISGSHPELKKKALELQRAAAEYLNIFKLPESEQIQIEQICRWYISAIKSVKGKMIITNNFICFASDPNEELTFILPIGEIKAVTKDVRRLSGVDLKEHIISFDACGYSFCFLSPNSILTIYYFLEENILKKTAGNPLIPLDARIIPKQAKFIGLEGVLEESHFTKQEALLDAMTNYYSEGYTAISNYKSKKLKEIIIQRGLPDCLRGALWQIWAGSDHFLRSNPGEYEKIISRFEDHTNDRPHKHDIEKDLHRTFPQHPYFNTEEGLGSLRRVLLAYASLSTSGYMQSMNFVCAYLRVFMSEEETFWLFNTTCEHILPQYYIQSPSMLGAVLSQKVLCDFLVELNPIVYRHLYSLSVPLPVICLSWFTTLFIGRLSMEATFRVLDWFFYVGHIGLMQIALAIFKILSKSILEMTDQVDISLLLKDELTLIEANELLSVASSEYGNLSKNRFEELWRKHKYAVMAGLNKKYVTQESLQSSVTMEAKPMPQETGRPLSVQDPPQVGILSRGTLTKQKIKSFFKKGKGVVRDNEIPDLETSPI